MEIEAPIRRLIEISYALDDLEKERTGLSPMLSREVYDYGIADPHWDWKRVLKEIDAFEADIETLAPERRPYLHGVVDAYRMIARAGSGEDIPYREKLKTYLQIDEVVIPDSELNAIKDQLCEKLAEAGFPDDMEHGYAQWKASRCLKFEELDAYGHEIMAEARRRVLALNIGFPDWQNTELNFPHDFPFRGYSSYDGKFKGGIRLNGDTPWEKPSLKHTIIHESFPGHQTFSAIREDLYNQGKIDVEATITFYETGISPIHEGECDLGQTLIDMHDMADDLIQDLATDYINGTETNLCIMANEGRLPYEEGTKILMERCCMDETLADVRYKYFTNPLWKTCFPHYYHGRKFIREQYQRMFSRGFKAEYMEMVFKHPHTMRTLRDSITEFLKTH